MSTAPEHNAQSGAKGRFTGLVIALTGLFWIGATWAGNHWDWSQRTRALSDLVALAGFAFALIVTFRIWRARQKHEG